jgi:hypothetical protein
MNVRAGSSVLLKSPSKVRKAPNYARTGKPDMLMRFGLSVIARSKLMELSKGKDMRLRALKYSMISPPEPADPKLVLSAGPMVVNPDAATELIELKLSTEKIRYPAMVSSPEGRVTDEPKGT